MDGPYLLNFSWDFNFNFSFFGNSSVRTNDSGTEDSEEEEVRSLAAAVITGVVLASIIVMTISGNVLVLLAVYVNSHLRSTTNYFIVNLAVADLLLGTTVLPFSASIEVLHYWPFGQAFCDVWAAVDVLCCTASITSLCAISLDRYIGVTKPLQHSSIMSEKRAGCIIICIWIIATTISVGPLIGWKDAPSPDEYKCEVTTQLGYVLFSVSGSFYIPLLIILIVYCRIYHQAIKQSRFLATGIKTSKVDESSETVTLRIHTGKSVTAKLASSSAPVVPPTVTTSTPGTPGTGPAYQSSGSSDHSGEGSGRKGATRITFAGKVAKFKREKKAAKTLGIVVGVFILCWLPFFFILPLSALCPDCYIPDLLFKFSFWLGYCNSVMNPVIYACSHKEFQRAFRQILWCRFRRKPRLFMQEYSTTSSNETSRASRSARGSTCRKGLNGRKDYSNTINNKRKSRNGSRKSNSGNVSSNIGVSPPENTALLSRFVTGVFGQRMSLESPIESLKQWQTRQPVEPSSSVGDALPANSSEDDEEIETVQHKTINRRRAVSLDDCTVESETMLGSVVSSECDVVSTAFAEDEEYVNSVLTKKPEHQSTPSSTKKLRTSLRLKIPAILISDEPSRKQTHNTNETIEISEGPGVNKKINGNLVSNYTHVQT